MSLEHVMLGAMKARPYYARALSALTPVYADWVPTIAVSDRWHLLINRAWFDSIPAEHQIGVIAGHEIEHLLRHHGQRRGMRDAKAWNVACDAEINDDCDLPLPAGGVYPNSLNAPDHLTAEEYYDAAEASASQVPAEGSGVTGEPLPGEETLTGGIPEEGMEPLLDAVAGDVVAHQARNPGSVPAHALVWASARAARMRVPLPRLVSRTLRGALSAARGRDDYTWSRPSRRVSDVLRPGMVTQRPRVAVVVDTSGSMADAGEAALSAVRAAVRAYELACVVVCDAAVHTMSRTVPRSWRGGGGTDLRLGISAAERSRPDAVLVITDGETPWPAQMAIPLVVVCTTDIDVPPWASVVRVRS